MRKIYVTAEEIESIECFYEEQETAINWFRDEDIITICTSDITMITKLKAMIARDPEHYRCYYYETNRSKTSNKLGNYFFEVPKNLLSFRCGNTREYTEEQKQAFKERITKKSNENNQ